jgi:hypothetical protein
MKELTKQILARAVGLFLATFFAGTGVGSIATNGDWWLGSIIGVGTAFAAVLTMIGVSLTWQGSLDSQDVANAFRAAVAKAAESNENLEAALKVEKDGDFTFDDVEFDDEDPEVDINDDSDIYPDREEDFR